MPAATVLTTILVIEDDAAVRGSVRGLLEHAGFHVVEAPDGATGLARALSVPSPDLILLDLILPDIYGLEVLGRLRLAGRATPVVIVSALDTVVDRVAAIEAGADEYIAKPYEPAELISRLRLALRRTEGSKGAQALSLGDLTLNAVTHEAARGPRTFALTPTEFKLLSHLMTHAHRLVPLSELGSEVWGHDDPANHGAYLRAVSRLREKLDTPGEPLLLHVVAERGYVLSDAPPPLPVAAGGER